MTENPLVQVSKRQFDSSFSMLVEMVDICPEHVWTKQEGAGPFWQLIYHATYWVDFWLRDVYDGSEFRSVVFDEGISFELKREPTTGADLTKLQMQDYLMKIREKTDRIFGALTDDLLPTPIIPNRYDFTYADVIMGQIRHVMYHVGQCNLILRNNESPAVKWLAHNEERQ